MRAGFLNAVGLDVQRKLRNTIKLHLEIHVSGSIDSVLSSHLTPISECSWSIFLRLVKTRRLDSQIARGAGRFRKRCWTGRPTGENK
jgi:hypothetical protein